MPDRVSEPTDTEIEAAEDFEIDYGQCPYYARYESLPGHDPEATCAFGCRDEPACVTGQWGDYGYASGWNAAMAAASRLSVPPDRDDARHRYFATIDDGALTFRIECGYAKDDETRPCWPHDESGTVRDPAPQDICTYVDWAENLSPDEMAVFGGEQRRVPSSRIVYVRRRIDAPGTRYTARGGRNVTRCVRHQWDEWATLVRTGWDIRTCLVCGENQFRKPR